MKRRSFLARSLTTLALIPSWAVAASLDPIFRGPRTIVFHLRIVTEEKEYAVAIRREEMQARLIEFIRAQLVKASLQMPVFDENTYRQPKDYPSDWIFWIDCRVDLATRLAESPKTIGVVSVVIRRNGVVHLSGEPFSIFFTEKGAGDLEPATETAARDSLSRSVLDFIVAAN